MNPEYVYAPGEDDIVPNHANFGFGYIPADIFPDNIPIIYNEMLVTCERKTDASFEEDICEALQDDYAVILTRKYQKSCMQFDVQTTYTIPEWKPAIPYTIILMPLLTVAGSTFATYLTCIRHLKDTPSQALRPKPPRAMRHSILEKLKLWDRFGFNTKWNLRDSLRTKLSC